VVQNDDQSVYRSADLFLLRSPILPYTDGRGAGPGDVDDISTLAAFFRDNSIVEEAVAVASPSLFQAVEKAVGGEGHRLKPKHLRRLETALTKYHLRMTTRPTPFGLFAGVCIGGFGDNADVRIGTAHQTRTRPDMGWLARVVRQLEQDAAVLPTLNVCASGGWFLRGERIALRDQQDFTDGALYTRSEISVRYTSAVRDALQAAAQPVPFPVLFAAVSRRYPGMPEQSVRDFLSHLIGQGFLVTDLRPPPEADRPLDYVLERLAAAPDGADGEAAAALAAVKRAIEDYDRMPIGAGLPAFLAASERMLAVQPADHVLQVDVALHAHVTLPRSIARDLEQAAEILWRISPDVTGNDALRAYRRDFLERYGVGREVPLTELLTEGVGLGLPLGFGTTQGAQDAQEASERSDRPAAPNDQEKRRDRLLADLVSDALCRGRREILLDEDLVDRLQQGSPDLDAAPPSLELFVQVIAATSRALDAGDYRLVLRPQSPSHRAGAAFGRFSSLFPDRADDLEALVRAVPAPCPDTVRAMLVYEPLKARSRNVTAAPQWLEHRIRVGGAQFGDSARDLSLGDLAVRATHDRLHLVRLATGQPVTATAFHLLNHRTLAPDVARFLHDLGSEGVRPVTGWDWGPLRELPYLPRVRCERVVICPATWRLPDELTSEVGKPRSEEAWVQALDQWRAKTSMPREVLLAIGDQRIPLCLDEPRHLRILRREYERDPGLRLAEMPGGGEIPDGWLAGSDEPHANEIVVPLVRRPGAPPGAMESVADRLPRGTPTPRSVNRHIHLPGGRWLFAKVYGPAAGQDEVVRQRLTPLVADAVGQGVDNWFYIRYADPDPHLRLRFRAAGDVMPPGLLTAVHDWVDGLRAVGLAYRLELDTYDPEIERYGGPEAVDAAQRAFEGDSRTAIALLKAVTSNPGGPGLDVVPAASVVDLVRAFGGPEMLQGWLTLAAAPPGTATPDRESVSAVASLISVGALPGSVPDGSAISDAWEERRAALQDYAARIAELASENACWQSTQDIAASLVHMHCNRLLGVDRARESRVLALARAATARHLGQLRAGVLHTG
jgi:thiopeptide-type bacteriocin biosynthesis protein